MLWDSPHVAHDESSLSQVRHTEQVQHAASFGCALNLYLTNVFIVLNHHVKATYYSVLPKKSGHKLVLCLIYFNIYYF